MSEKQTKTVDQKLYEAFRLCRGVKLSAKDVEQLLTFDEAIGVLKGLSWHNDEISPELRDAIDKVLAELEAKRRAVQDQMKPEDK